MAAMTMNMNGYGGQGYMGQRQQSGFSAGAYAPQQYQQQQQYGQNYQAQGYGYQQQNGAQNGWGMTGPVQGGRPQSPTRGMNNGMMNPQMRDRHSSISEGAGGSDVNGLLNELNRMQQMGVRFIEAIYTVNWWSWNEWWVPLKHHGIVLKASNGTYMSFDYGRGGICWDMGPDFPQLPAYTCKVDRYNINVEPAQVAKYCRDTPGFNPFTHDCFAWTDKFMNTVLDVKDTRKCKKVSTEFATCQVRDEM